MSLLHSLLHMNSIYVMYQQIVYFKQLQWNGEQQQQTKKKQTLWAI